MLLDNVTNYSKPSLDYFYHKFDSDNLEIPLTWTLLLKMRKHKLLRLPSCAIEDDTDYNMYLIRLHHCLWRRWSIEHYNLDKSKVDPLSINWNKETDITVLYGPDLTGISEDLTFATKSIKLAGMKKHSTNPFEMGDEDLIGSQDTHSYTYSSSVDSDESSIFDDENTCMKTQSNTSTKSLKFKSTVLRRDIDSHGGCHETHVTINDTTQPAHRVRHHHHASHRHHHHGIRNNSANDHYITTTHDYEEPFLDIDDDDKDLQNNICNFKEVSNIRCN